MSAETPIVILVGSYKLIVIIGSIIAATVWITRKLTKLETKVEGFDGRLDTFETRFSSLEGLMDLAFSNASPLSLKPMGKKFIEESGLKKYIDDNKARLLSQCETKNPMTNSYDIQEAAFKFFDHIDLGTFEATLKKHAFNYGWSMNVVRRIGGIYFRDLCLEKAGLKPEDLED